MGDQGTVISHCCRLAKQLMQGTMTCVSDETNWGSGGWGPATSGRLPSKIRTTVSTKRTLWLLFIDQAFCYRATNSHGFPSCPSSLSNALELIFHSQVVCFVEFTR